MRNPISDLLRRPNQQIHPKSARDALANHHSLAANLLVGKIHDDEQIHIGVVRRFPIGIGTEQDHLQWRKLPNDIIAGHLNVSAVHHG